MRWLEIDLVDFTIVQEGFVRKSVGHRELYHSPGSEWVTDISQIREAEYAQLIVIDPIERTVAFGRDYLGHYPLTYAATRYRLYISDSYVYVHHAVRTAQGALTLSQEALALYFTMGYVPHGRSVYDEIVNCHATGYYLWKNGQVRRVNLFHPIEIHASESTHQIGEAIEGEVARLSSNGKAIDIWCSGGLDSSIMAIRFNSAGRRADLLTLSYGNEIHESWGDGEGRFVRAIAKAANAPVREVELNSLKFMQMHTAFAAHHNGPVIDFPLPPKYALAEATRDIAVTGEAGDTFFGGTKNSAMAYAIHKQPGAKLGKLFALAHQRYFEQLGTIFKYGRELSCFAEEYCEKLTQAYPGDTSRKLFYLNAHEKLGGMIFHQSYFPSQIFGKQVRHPLASLAVYEAAFRVPDHRKFSYPFSKIALMELYESQLPSVIVRRKKSGTQIPLDHYLDFLCREPIDFSALAEAKVFREDLLEKLCHQDVRSLISPQLLYAFITLNLWLKTKESPHVESLSPQSGHHKQSRIIEHV